MNIPNPYLEDRKKSKGEIEVEHGSFLLMFARAFKVPMPNKGDQAAIERAGQLFTRRWPWLAYFTQRKKP